VCVCAHYEIYRSLRQMESSSFLNLILVLGLFYDFKF
jgi:hypothetical protein